MVQSAHVEDEPFYFLHFPSEETAAKHARKIRLRTYNIVRHREGWAIEFPEKYTRFSSFAGKATRMQGKFLYGAYGPGEKIETLEQGRRVENGKVVFPPP